MSNATNITALVTGASSGIGLAIARELAQRGYGLLLVSNQQQALESCCAELSATYKVPCRYFFADLTAPDAAQQVYDFCHREGLNISILVNNAGMLLFNEIVEAPPEKIQAIIQLHMYTPTMLCRLFGADMKQQRAGHILNVGSISAVLPYPGISIYGPTKTYLRYFSRALRGEMKLYNVSVTCVLPGATETALYDPNKVNLKLATQLGVMHPAAFVARRAVKSMLRGRAECIPGWLNKLTVALMPWLPMWMIHQIHRRTQLLATGKEVLG